MKRVPLLAFLAGTLLVGAVALAAAFGAFASPASTGAAGRAGDSAQAQHLKVHGLWTIEVRNRAGKVVARRHVENSLTFGGEVALARIFNHGTLGPWGIRLT